MRGFSSEQLLAVADEYCAFHGCHVRSFAALAVSAAVPGARFHGVPVFDSVEAAAAALAETIRALQPLSGANAGFADIAAEVYRRWAE
ncbi:TetR family transcriptional regulator [Corynebacterium sp. MSK008]|uniref:TetR family transcriptional regulator n=1 Tax=Corynebacterium sp. MSK008 TaxID=3050188 RepID=UPI00254A4324|nr:TetR family transcriptional regulator [Corynebacterium sp. MSK008]MDK8878650.1 TetR family transcriptional regulator [Corynebacterium sp. MSK008]